MTRPPAVTLSVCPHCGERMLGDADACAACGQRIEREVSEERQTFPVGLDGVGEQSESDGDNNEGRDEEEADDEQSEELPNSAYTSSEPPPESDRGDGDIRNPNLDEIAEERESFAPGPDPLIGLEVAGRYRILECIGRGGMGVVYKVEHTEIGKLLALKLLAGELSREREVVKRFKREALLASRLSHPNSVQVFDFGVFESLTFLVMELVTGNDLARVVKIEGHLPFDRVAKIIVQVCSSLAEAHGMGIVHRDLKPENILIARTKEGGDFAKVLDFGLAKLREAPELNEVTGSGSVVGTPYYMAPEQICGKPVDNRADIYALGAVMYKALTGETVFPGTTPMAVFTKHLTELPVPPHERAPGLGIPESISHIVMRALEKDPANRYQRVEELQAALIEELGGLGQSSIKLLLNSAELRVLHETVLGEPPRESEESPGMSRTLMRRREAATRDEVEAFKRKLARQRLFGYVIAALVAVIGCVGSVHLYRMLTAPPVFRGQEIEPNNSASEALAVPFGSEVKGMIAKRIDQEHSDRDFFRIIVPEPTVSVECKGIPNMALCVWTYRLGEDQPSAKLCAGKVGADLVVPALRLEPGAYLFAVMQDRQPSDARSNAHVLENISDWYVFRVGPASPTQGVEVEPNDAPTAGVPLQVGQEVKGRIGWTDDIDVVCVTAGPSEHVSARWAVTDALEHARERGAVLEVTPTVQGRPGPLVRLRRADPIAAKPSTATEVYGTWRSEPFRLNPGERACVQLQLGFDTLTSADSTLRPPVSNEQWAVRAENVP